MDSGAIPPRLNRSSWPRLVAALAVRAVFNPNLARDLITAAWAFRRRDWLTTPPFLPLPAPEYMRWRMYTAYGDERAVPPLDDVIRFARWRRQLLRL
jgi:hypothetical protein